jgi:hypothetical protein
MHAVLLTLLTLGGGVDAYSSGRITQSSADIYNASASVGDAQGATMSYAGDYGAGCGDACGGGGCRHGHAQGSGFVSAWFGHMPQTCYDPRYGCYSGNARYVQRYPAFHGTFYRRAYNYRNYFDYPWHAEMHEPTSMFSYNVVSETSSASPESINIPTPAPAPVFEEARRSFTPSPNAPYAADARLQSNLRRAVPAGAYQRNIADPNVSPAATMRR